MAKQPILVAAREIHGGTQKEPHVTKAGTRLTETEQKKLGLSNDDVDQMTLSGAFVEKDAYVGDDNALPPGQTAPGTTGTEFEGLGIDEMRQILKDAKVKFTPGASAQDLMKIALEHKAPPAGTGDGGAPGGTGGNA